MICYNCGSVSVSEINKNCPMCGMNFPVKCKNCNEYNPLYSKHCANCGFKLGNNDYGSLIKNFDILNETRRKVAVIFADVSGFTALSEKMDPEEIREVMNGCFEYITKPVYELEGTIDKFIGDCVMILFGAKYSHSDDAKRAVKCALRMMDLIKEYSRERLFEKGIELNLSIGVSYGLVVTGEVGNQYDKDYTVMGDTVNTAQRLQSSAGRGNILVSEQCYNESNDLIEYSELKEVLVKNKEKAVKCYNALNIKKENDIDKIKLFERDKEIDLILSVYSKTENTRFINVIGESGIGKTSFIKSFCEEIADTAVKKIWVNCSPMYKNKVYYAISEILFNVTAIKPEDNMDVKKSKLKTYINLLFRNRNENKIDKNYNFLSLVMGLERSEDFNKTLKSMEYKDLNREIELQLDLFFQNLYKLHDYIFIIDDLQWADDNSIRILKKLADNMNNANSFYVFISQYELEGMGSENSIVLCKISQTGIKDMIKLEFGTDDVDEVLLNGIIGFTEGNPLFVKEYISAIKRKNTYFIHKNMVCIKEEEINQLPNSIESIILSNLSELDEKTTMFLQVASCIGKEFNVNWVAKILEKDINEEEAVEALKQLNIISLKNVYTSEGILNKVYNFNQETTRKVVYGSILNKNKREFNQRIGDFIEQVYYEDIERYYAELYEYFYSAENLNKAKDYSIKAAVKYKNDYNFNSALDYYNTFINFMNDCKEDTADIELARSYKDMGYIYSIIGEWEKALEYLNKALSLSTIAEDVYSIKLIIAGVYKDMSQYEETLKIINDIEPKIRVNSNIYGKLLLLKCTTFYVQRNANALSVAEESENILLKTKDYDNLSQTENLIGLIYFSKGDKENALFYLNKAYEHCEKTFNLKSMCSISGNLGVVYHASGRISKAIEYFYKALEISEKISDVQRHVSANINLGILLMEKGSFNRAEELFKKAFLRAKQISLIYLNSIILSNLGDLMYEKGEFKEALDYYTESLEIVQKHEMIAEEGINLY